MTTPAAELLDSGERPFDIDDPVSLELQDILDGKYQLLERLDEGGMGSVFVAHNMALDVPVAVKIIRADLHGPDKRVLAERLLQEARATARLGHPAIVRMMDFGVAPNGDPYLVMELLEGEDLASALKERGQVSPATAVRILLPIAHALAAAHEKGIVHRDLKPQNIYLAKSPGGQVQPKLIDFGIAKLPQRGVRRLTMAGDTMGTPDYMSPEQARGQDVDAQADIWGFSVILYEMICGTLPFAAPNNMALLRAIIEDEPVALETFGVEDAGLSAIVLKGLTKNKTERWAQMRELGTELAQWLLDQGHTDDVSGASLRSAWLQAQGEDGAHDVLRSIPPPELTGSAGITIVGVTAPAPEANDRAEDAPSAGAAPAAALRPSRWPLVLLWLLTLAGIAAAITGWLRIDLPGLPARLPPIW